MFEDFNAYLLKEKRASTLTVQAYVKDVGDFFEFAEISENEIQEVNYQVIRSWIVSLINNGISNRSVNRKLSSLRTFFKWAKSNGLVKLDPMLRVKGPKQEKRLPEFVRKEELVKDKLDTFYADNIYGLRDGLMIEVFYQTGMRLSELVGLKDKNIESSGLKVLGKRNKERIIPISKELYIQLDEFIALKKSENITTEYLFFTDKGEKLYSKFVYRKINYYLSRVTSLGKKSPHVLRHTFATHMLNNGAGLETLKELLGHANLSATQIYTHNSFDEINKVYKQAHPRGHKND